MDIDDIKILGDECLRGKSASVETGERGEVPPLLDEMIRLMKKSGGVGLAAPQVGINKRIIILESGKQVLEIINPVIAMEEGAECMVEGCLSIPGAEVEVKRAGTILLGGLNRSFKPVKYRLEGLPARIAQHEIDHLDGKLIVDYLSIIKRKAFDRKWKRNSK